MGQKPQRILIAEDHTLLRRALTVLLENHDRYVVAGEASDGFEAVKMACSLVPDVVLMDLSMPKMNGTEAIIEIKKQCANTRILVLTAHDNEEMIFETLRAGVSGYILKDDTETELMNAIDAVAAGKTYLSPGISSRVVNGYLTGKGADRASTPLVDLSAREREVLKLIAEGYKNKEIADLLYVSETTVRKHRANIMEKLDLHNASALTAFAIEHGLLE
ncbi:MAG: response regulator transcription factor [Deltaproteobacteria bacterium]|nr:response regulator transcription factor [Candidatus Zymogenaceae bacterium]